MLLDAPESDLALAFACICDGILLDRCIDDAKHVSRTKVGKEAGGPTRTRHWPVLLQIASNHGSVMRCRITWASCIKKRHSSTS